MVLRSRSKSWRLTRLEAISPRGAPPLAVVSNSRSMKVTLVAGASDSLMCFLEERCHPRLADSSVIHVGHEREPAIYCQPRAPRVFLGARADSHVRVIAPRHSPPHR